MTDSQKCHLRVAKKFRAMAEKTIGFQREYYNLMAKWHETQAKG